MKTSIFKLSSLLLMLLLGMGSANASFTVRTGQHTTLTFEVNEDDPGTVTLIKCCGEWHTDSTNSHNSFYQYDETIVIPETVVYEGTEKTVTDVGNDDSDISPVFENCLHVVFPSTLKKIGEYGLTFKHFSKTYEGFPFTSVPNVFDFSEATSLEQLECYWGDDALNSALGNSAYSLENLTIRKGMDLGNDFPFRFAKNLQYDESSTVYDCINGCLMQKGDNETVVTILRVPEVTVPATVKRIAHSMPLYNGEEKTHIAFEDDCQLKTIGGQLNYCVLSELPSSLKNCITLDVGSTFEYSEFEQFTLPADMSGFQQGSFEGVTFNAFDWGENPQLSERLFANCTFKEDLSLPEGMTSTAGAFNGCTFKGRLLLPKSFTTLHENEFSYCKFHDGFSWPDGIKAIPTKCFDHCTFYKKLVLPESVTIIKPRSFEYSSLLSSLELPEGLQAIEAEAFRNLNFNNGTLVMPPAVTVHKDAFVSCQIYKMVWTGDTFDGLGSMAPGEQFSYLRYLDSCYTVQILDLGTSIPTKDALTYFPRRAKIYTHCKTPPTVTSLIDQQGHTIQSEYVATLYVPKGCKEIYSNTSPWRYYPNIVEFDETQQMPFVGDVNGDGRVNVSDIAALVNEILTGPTEQNFLNDDVNEDSKVNVSDISTNINKILGIK